MTSPLQRASVCLPLLFFCTVNCAGNTATDELLKYSLQDKILEFIERTMQYYYYSDVTNTDRDVDLNLMLGISIMKDNNFVEIGQFLSCTHNTLGNYDVGFDRVDIRLNTMIDKFYVKFYENNLTDLKTTKKLLDHRLWTSARKIMRKSRVTPLPRGFDENLIANGAGDLYFRNISDKCILQVISTCKMSAECVGPELADDYFGYALTHQMNCNNPIVQNLLDKVIRDKCSKMFDEAMYIANDFNTLTKHKDLFIEQIVICGMQNMVEFIRPEWLSILSSKRHFDCIQQKNNNSSCDAHMTGVSLAALGVYWKFLCYKANTHAEYIDFQNTIIV